MIRRERVEKMVFARLFAAFARTGTTVSPEALEPMLGAYARAVNHDLFRFPARRQDLRKKQREQKDADLLRKVSEMTAPEEDLLTTPPKPGKRKRRGHAR